MHEFLALPAAVHQDHAGALRHRDRARGAGRGPGSGLRRRPERGRVAWSDRRGCACRPAIGGDRVLDRAGRPRVRLRRRDRPAARDLRFALGLPRVRLACDVRNLASVRTALDAGFAFEGVARDGVSSIGTDDARTRYGDLARFARVADDPGEPLPHAFADLPAGGLTDGVIVLRTLLPVDVDGLAGTDDELDPAAGLRRAVAHSLRECARATATAGLDRLVGTRATWRSWTPRPASSRAR